MPKRLEHGRSWRTEIKLDLMRNFVGEEAGALRMMSNLRGGHWFDLTAGNGEGEPGVSWKRGCSPGILAWSAVAIAEKSEKALSIVLYEINPVTFSRLITNLDVHLPDMGYCRDGETNWRFGPRVTIDAVNGDGRMASVDHLTRNDAALVLNDPNAVPDWAMRDSFPAEAASRAWCCRTLSTMGCNAAGIKRLPREERDGWFLLVEQQERALPDYRDLLLAAIERDSAQWAYLFSTAAKWQSRTTNIVRGAFERYGRTAELAWRRTNPAEFQAAKQRLFLTKQERDAS